MTVRDRDTDDTVGKLSALLLIRRSDHSPLMMLPKAIRGAKACRRAWSQSRISSGHSGHRQRCPTQAGEKGEAGDVYAARQPGELHLDEFKLVVDRVEVGSRGVGLPQAQPVFGWFGHEPSYAPQSLTGG
jgi:hypothetical protein